MTIGFLVTMIWVLRPELPTLLFGNALARHKGNTLLLLLSAVWLIGSLAETELNSQLPMLQERVQAMRGVQIEMANAQGFTKPMPLVDRVGLHSEVQDQANEPDTVLFTVESQQPPGYMRTVSFSDFDGEQWRNRWDGRRRRANELLGVRATTLLTWRREPAAANMVLPGPWYSLSREQSTDGLLTFDVSIPFGRGGLVPVPVGSRWIQCALSPRTRALMLDAHRNVWSGAVNNQRYRLLGQSGSETFDTTGNPVTSEYLNTLLVIPPTEQFWIERVAAQRFANAGTFEQRCRAVETFFVNNFEYATQNSIAQVRGNRTKLQTFVEDQMAAHCEYFAAATVLLLRSQGIPTRLSTGYLVYELDNNRELFAARKRNAHAWAEAYDASTNRWRVVESTPGTESYINRLEDAERNQTTEDQVAGQETDYALGGSLRRAWEWLLMMIWRFFLWQHSWIVFTICIVLLLLYRTSQHVHRYDGWRYSKEVRRADRKAKRLGYQRGVEETCLRFAERLGRDPRPQAQQLATWYAKHGNERYQMAV